MATSLEAAAAGTALEDLPEDTLLAILALLAPPDAAAASCACRRLAAAASSPALPLALALRFGLPPPRPLLPSPTAARRLLRSLHRLHRLLGLWRRLSSHPAASPGSPSLAAFEWAPRATLAASLLAPSPAHGFAVSKFPFVTLSIADSGDTVAALGDVPVCVNFIGDNHIVVEAASASASGEDDEEGMDGGSPPEEMYMHFANRRSPGAGRRRRRERQGRRRGGRMEVEHFVRIVDAEPTDVRPLQGLWKELDHYSGREHIRGVASGHTEIENRAVSRILYINSSYDVVDPHLLAPLEDMRNVEGRIWLYEDGAFGFGFTGSNSIIDLRHVSSDGCILDTSY